MFDVAKSAIGAQMIVIHMPVKILSYQNDKINELDGQIINLLKDNKYLNIPELSKETNKSEPTIHRHLYKLYDLNFLKRTGSRKTEFWEVLI